jgi:hypothetical protein
MNRSIFKGIRPWEIVDVSESLDASKTWIGIEYETGFHTKKAYDRVCNYIWNNFNHTALDLEGCGAQPLEITFPPVHMEDFQSDEYFINKAVKYFNSAKYLAQDYSPAHLEVGIHCNISTPKYRAAGWSKQEEVVGILNTSLGTLGDTECDLLFNRNPYAGFFWLFKSTDDLETINGYKQIIVRLAALIETLCDTELEEIDRWEGDEYCSDQEFYVVTNFYDILSGKATAPEFEYRHEDDVNAEYYHW